MNSTNARSLADKVVLITGASRGLGRALALAVAREGAELALVSRPAGAGDLLAVQAELRVRGSDALAIHADVGSRADVERVVAESLAHFGRVDVLVNNASALGLVPMPLLLDTPIDAFEAVQRVNVTGPFLLTRALIGPMLARNKGLVLNVSSDAGVIGYPHWGAYGVSKAGLDQLTRIWAAELEGPGVGIVAIDPGSMNTLMHRLAEPDEDPTQWADPSAVAHILVALAAADPARVNGRRFEAQAPRLLEELRVLGRAAEAV